MMKTAAATTAAAAARRVPCCMFCYNIQQNDPSVRTDHWLKDKQGNVLCERLKNTVCRKCNKKGHTVKQCTVREKKHTTVAPTHDTTTPPPVKTSNPFDALAETEENFPYMPLSAVPLPLVRHSNADFPHNYIRTKSFADIVKITPPNETEKKVFDNINQKKVFKKNWADYDSDDEDSDEY